MTRIHTRCPYLSEAGQWRWAGSSSDPVTKVPLRRHHERRGIEASSGGRGQFERWQRRDGVRDSRPRDRGPGRAELVGSTRGNRCGGGWTSGGGCAANLAITPSGSCQLVSLEQDWLGIGVDSQL